jgi:hypothetical protein
MVLLENLPAVKYNCWMKLYLGCSLMQAPEDFKKWIEDLKNTLRASYENENGVSHYFISELKNL